jgi:hypothetical protein
VPVYTIEGKRVRTEKPLSDDEIDEIASTLRPAAPAATAPAPPPKLMLPGDRAMGFREAGAPAVTTEEREALAEQAKMLPLYALSLGAGPLAGGALRGIAAVTPRAGPVLRGAATALESGGFQSGLSATAPRAAQIAARGTAGGAVGGVSAGLINPEEAEFGAGAGAALSVFAPPLVSKFAGAVGSGLDWMGGRAADIRAARMLRGVLPDEQLNALRQAVLAQPDVPPSRTISQLNLPPAERRPVEILQSLLEKAEKKDPQGVAAAFRTTEGEALQTRLAAIAGGETAEAALTTRKTAQEALRTATTPMREEALAAARRTGEVMPRLETVAEEARATVKANVDFVRRVMPALNKAEDWAANWTPSPGRVDGQRLPGPIGEAGVRLPERALSTSTFPGQLAASGRQTTVGGPFERTVIDEGGAIARRVETAAQTAVREGARARAAENTLQSMVDRGLQPITIDKFTRPIDALMRDPEVTTNPTLKNALPQIRQMFEDWTNEFGVVTPEAVAAIRKNGVSGVIQQLMPQADAKTQSRMAASVLSKLRPVIDDAIEKAGGKGWSTYLNTFESGMSQIRAMELADQIRKRYSAGKATAADKQYIVDLVSGESPEVLEELFGSGKYKIGEQMAKDMPLLKELADTIGFDLKFAEQAKAGRAALTELTKEQAGWRVRFPFFTRASTAVNEIASALEDKVANDTMLRLIQAAQSGRNFDAAIMALPASERNKVLSVLRTPAQWNRFATGVATAAAGSQTVEPRNALAPESQNALAE